MGHLDNDDDKNETTYTVKVFMPGNTTPSVYNGCSDYESDSGEPNYLTFTDSAGKEHTVNCTAYEVTEE